MKNNKLILTLFVLAAIAQLLIPGKMIYDREEVLDTGQTYNFKTIPVDPNDPFRGKYIDLRFKENTFELTDKKDWTRNQDVFVLIESDSGGYASIKDVFKEAPSDKEHYLKAKIIHVNSYRIRVKYPFDRYYMEESKAYDAEQLYRESLSDAKKVAYAVVKVKNGMAVLEDVQIDGVSIREIVQKKMDAEKK